MKKLKIKLFLTIYLILSIFIIFVLGIINIKTYRESYDNVSTALRQASFSLKDYLMPSENSRQIFLNYNIYTVIYDDSDNILQIISHLNSDTYDEENIQTVAKKILNSDENYHIGNLYFSKYSYLFENNNSLVILDNKDINKSLLNFSFQSIIYFIIMEIFSALFTYYLTKNLIKPVEDAFENQKRFIADASHELKTPIAVMIASVDAYNNDHDEKWINNIKSESERMNHLVKDLLDLAFLEGAKITNKKEENLSSIIESATLTFESLFYEKDVKLNYDIMPNIYFNCNNEEIKELLGILLDNALKHSEKSSCVNISLQKENKDIILTVRNKGKAIKKGDEEKIFERFYKEDASRKRENNNYGLGLAIAKRITENHHGKISAFSKNGYTTFKVILNQK